MAFGNGNEVRGDELLTDADLHGSPLHETTFSYRNNIYSRFGEWMVIQNTTKG